MKEIRWPRDPAAIARLIETELGEVEDEISAQLDAESSAVVELGTHLLKAGGKRLRPTLVILAGRMWGAPHPALISMAAAVEILHMATLVHDDSIDRASLRRGLPTINAQWGDAIAILVGDFLFARAFGSFARTGDRRIVTEMAELVFQMSVGEIDQQRQAYDVRLSMEQYEARIERKTALFIARCCALGAELADAGPAEVELLRKLGWEIGMAYQVTDDLLDYTASGVQLGKPAAEDLRSGMLTLPVLWALHQSTHRDEIRTLISDRRLGDEEVAQIGKWIEECGGFSEAQRAADQHTRKALAILEELPGGDWRDAFAQLIGQLSQRRY